MRASSTIADEIERYLRTGDADMDAWAWPGDFMERDRRQHADLRGALVAEIERTIQQFEARRATSRARTRRPKE